MTGSKEQNGVSDVNQFIFNSYWFVLQQKGCSQIVNSCVDAPLTPDCRNPSDFTGTRRVLGISCITLEFGFSLLSLLVVGSI